MVLRQREEIVEEPAITVPDQSLRPGEETATARLPSRFASTRKSASPLRLYADCEANCRR